MKRTVVYIGAAAILFFVWWILSSFLTLPIVPNPWSVVSCLQSIFLSSIAIHAIYSLGRIALGLVLAVGIGYPIGIFMGYAAKADRIFSPFVYLMYPVPKIALLPILMLLAGVGEISKVLMLFLIIVFQVIIAVRDAVRAIPQETYMPLLSLGASLFSIFRHVLWPASLPKFITAVRVAMATAISVLFFTETFGSQYGLGYFIMDAWLRVNYLEMYAGIVVLSLLGLLLFSMLDFIEMRVCRWQYK
mgnify:FL=1